MAPDHCHRLVRVTHPGDLLVARGTALQLGADTRLDATHKERFALILTELGTNLARHAPGGGTMLLRRLDGGGGLECICYDRGPGIADLGQALRDGASSGGGLGLGLGAVRRLADEFAIHSELGVGTAILARVGKAAPDIHGLFPSGAVMVPMAGMEECGDGWVVTRQGVVAVIDGLGHGPEAAVAARRAEASAASGHDDPRRAIEAMHIALRGTRGAVAMVARMDQAQVRFSGVGNIAAALIGTEKVTSLHSSWGVVGGNVTPPKEHAAPWQAGDVLLMNTDGLSHTVQAFAARRLRYVDPTLASAIVLRDASSKLDDQTVLVVRR